MSIRNKFHIPSAAEMEKETRSSSDSVSGTNSSSLFNAHRKTLQSNTAREKDTKSTLKVTGPKTTTATQNESGTARPSIIDSCATSSRQLHEVTKSQQGIFPHTANSMGTAKANPVKCDQILKTFSLPGESKKVEEKNCTSGASTGDNASTSCEGNKSSPSRPGNIHAIIVSARQRGNPVLKYIRNVPWEFGDLVADYQMGQSTCALFLSLRYHNLNPNYIHERLKQLGHSYNLRILLVQVDIKDPTHCICELAKMCILADCTLILAFTAEEAGKYLETYKSFETKPPDLIMEKTEGNFIARMTDALTTVKSVNKTDANTLQNTFGSLEKVVEASEEDLSFCPGFGPQKAKRLHSVFQEPFLREKKRKFSESPVKGSPTKLCAPRSGSSKGKPS